MKCIEFCGNCVWLMVDKWLFPKVDGNCTSPIISTSTRLNDGGIKVHMVFNRKCIDPNRVACDTFSVGAIKVEKEVVSSQDKIWSRTR